MTDRPERVVESPRADPTLTGEVGSEGGSPGDLLRPVARSDRADTDGDPRSVPALLWIALLMPILVVLLWFATSLF